MSLAQFKDESGKRYGRLTVIGKVRKKRGQPRILETRKALWFCRCDCGLNTRVLGNRLRSGSVKSCVSCKIDEDKMWGSKLVRGFDFYAANAITSGPFATYQLKQTS